MLKKVTSSLLVVLLTLTTALALPKPRVQPKWDKLEGCTLITNKWNDGDSFHVAYNGKEFIFRLYFVATSETANRFPKRVAEQAAYFSCTSKRAMEIGKEAAVFTSKTLTGKAFTVFTCWQDAMGASALPRYYGIVEIGGKNLAELLVENGFARIYGKRITLPDGRDPKTYRSELKAIETRAQVASKGAWVR